MSTETRRLAASPYSTVDESAWSTASYPLGAHFDGADVTFAVYSSSATRVLLEIYDQATGRDAQYEFWMRKNPEDNVWRAKLAQIPEGTLYGFRCWGPNWGYDTSWRRGNSATGFGADVDEAGNRFNPNKVLFDPYTRELSHDKETPSLLQAGHNGGMYGTGGELYKGVRRREFDTGPWAPKGIVLRDRPFGSQRRQLPPENAIIYEAHVRGVTQHPSSSDLNHIIRGVPGLADAEVASVPAELRGTYAGAAYMAPYLSLLGFTTIELLPVQETDNDANDVLRAQGGNYWGYMTFGYFAPDRRYAHDKSPGGPTREFKEMVRAFHDAGLEVYLDVVYNHTGEGGNWGKLDTTGFVSLGGFDAPEYYVQTDEHYLVDGATGCGNQVNYSSRVAQDLVIDSLRYWTEVMGVDGFRFDLAPVLGRSPNDTERENWDEQKRFFQQSPLLLKIRDLAREKQIEVIAEAWDIWGYEVGNFPADWGEWNGRYRDAVRDFIRGQGNTLSFVERINGDYANFNDQGGPQRSINFVNAHDGFTLADLVSYSQKTNWQLDWPFGPSGGGSDDNRSYDWGGDRSLRRQQVRNVWTLLFFSRGVPMVVWGDEFGRTQNGNNNAYGIDSVATWSNYETIGTHHPQAVATGGGGAYHDNLGTADGNPRRNPLFQFARFVGNLRRNSSALQQRQYADLVMESGGDVTYDFRALDGQTSLTPGDRCVWLRIDASQVGEQDFLVLMNMAASKVRFQVPRATSGSRWLRRIDTAAWAEEQDNCWTLAEAAEVIGDYEVHPRSIVVLQEVG